MSNREDQVFGVWFNSTVDFLTGWIVGGASGSPLRFTQEEAERYLTRYQHSDRYEIRRLPEGIRTVRR
jgi:hypothetical protein